MGKKVIRRYRDISKILRERHGYHPYKISHMSKRERIEAIRKLGYHYDPQSAYGTKTKTTHIIKDKELIPISDSKVVSKKVYEDLMASKSAGERLQILSKATKDPVVLGKEEVKQLKVKKRLAEAQSIQFKAYRGMKIPEKPKTYKTNEGIFISPATKKRMDIEETREQLKLAKDIQERGATIKAYIPRGLKDIKLVVTEKVKPVIPFIDEGYKPIGIMPPTLAPDLAKGEISSGGLIFGKEVQSEIDLGGGGGDLFGPMGTTKTTIKAKGIKGWLQRKREELTFNLEQGKLFGINFRERFKGAEEYYSTEFKTSTQPANLTQIKPLTSTGKVVFPSLNIPIAKTGERKGILGLFIGKKYDITPSKTEVLSLKSMGGLFAVRSAEAGMNVIDMGRSIITHPVKTSKLFAKEVITGFPETRADIRKRMSVEPLSGSWGTFAEFYTIGKGASFVKTKLHVPIVEIRKKIPIKYIGEPPSSKIKGSKIALTPTEFEAGIKAQKSIIPIKETSIGKPIVIEMAPVHTIPITKKALIKGFGDTKQFTIHATDHPSMRFPASRSGKPSAILLKADPSLAKGFRKGHDLLGFYRSVPTDQGRPLGYMAYMSDISPLDYPSKGGIRFSLFHRRQLLIEPKTHIRYYPPMKGESLTSFAERLGEKTGETYIPPENIFGKSIERQVVSPSEFVGVRGKKYIGSYLMKRKNLGITYYKQDIGLAMLMGKTPRLKKGFQTLGLGVEYKKIRLVEVAVEPRGTGHKLIPLKEIAKKLKGEFPEQFKEADLRKALGKAKKVSSYKQKKVYSLSEVLRPGLRISPSRSRISRSRPPSISRISSSLSRSLSFSEISMSRSISSTSISRSISSPSISRSLSRSFSYSFSFTPFDYSPSVSKRKYYPSMRIMEYKPPPGEFGFRLVKAKRKREREFGIKGITGFKSLYTWDITAGVFKQYGKMPSSFVIQSGLGARPIVI